MNNVEEDSENSLLMYAMEMQDHVNNTELLFINMWEKKATEDK